MTKGDKERYRVQAAIAAMPMLIRKNIELGLTAKDCANDACLYADALMAELGLGEEE